MKIFAIGDLHLAEFTDKPMDIFGEHWLGHTHKIMNHWTQIVKEEDLVLIPGDISWAMRMEGAQKDLDLIEHLPGKKICIRGNHDYWWDRPGKLNESYRQIYFLQNKAYSIGKKAICGTRGWICPNQYAFSQEDERIFDRELIRLTLSLEDALKQKANQIIVMLHYPPTFGKEMSSPILDLFKKYPIRHVIYGHLHDPISWQDALQGSHQGIHYHLVAADYLAFSPLLITES